MTFLANSGKLSIDKTISELCQKVWDIAPVDVPKPSLNATQRVRSYTNLTALSNHNASEESIELSPDPRAPHHA